MQTHFIKFILIALSMTPSLPVYANAEPTAKLYCKKSGRYAGEVQSLNGSRDFMWEDVPSAVLRCDAFDNDTLDVERAMADILKWPGTKITQSFLDQYFKGRMPFIKVDYVSGGALLKCKNNRYTTEGNQTLYKGFKPETLAKFPGLKEYPTFKLQIPPLKDIPKNYMDCLAQDSDLDPKHFCSSDPIYTAEAKKIVAPFTDRIKTGLSKVLPNKENTDSKIKK